MIWESLFDLVTGRFGIEAVSGPVGVTTQISEAASTGAANIIYLAIVISINLGVVNLLPFPALDGGRTVFILLEMIRRKPVPVKYEGMVHFIGIIVLMIFMLIITLKDIITLF
jgi:regulator of sigma E protease